MTAALIVADIPIVSDVVGAVFDNTIGWDGITNWVLGAVGFFVGGTVDFLLNSASPDLTSAWFSGPGSPFATVRNIAGLLLLGFLFLGIIQGLLAGDVSAMVRRVSVDLPGAIIGMVATTVVADRLIVLTDALSTEVLSNSDGQALHFLSGFGVTVTTATQGFAAVLLGLVAILAGFLVWVELMIRSVLIYVLVALSPLAFATTVWPAAKGVMRRMIELTMAVVFSKLVIAIAISVGVAALSGAGAAGPNGAPIVDQAAAGMGTLFVGTAVLMMAAFSPFLLLKLIPMAEAALVAQGVSRSPVRGVQATIGNVHQAQSLTRLAGTNSQGALPTGGQQSGQWAASTAPRQAIGAGSGGSGAAALAGPAGVAVAGGAVAVSAGRRAVDNAQRSTAAASDRSTRQPPRPQRPQRRPPSPGGGERR